MSNSDKISLCGTQGGMNSNPVDIQNPPRASPRPIMYREIKLLKQRFSFNHRNHHTKHHEISGHTPNSGSSVMSTVPAVSNNNKTLSRLILEHQDLINHHKSCLSHLEKIYNEAETLRQENTNLRIANSDLNNRLNLLIQATLQNHYAAMMSSSEYGDASLSSVLDQFGGMTVGGGKRRESAGRLGDEEYFSPPAAESPTSVLDGGDRAYHKVDVDRVSLPNSLRVFLFVQMDI